ncbi:gamma-glutamyl-gamma-aminobutyrate hydrolase family protein [Acetobacterium woodii]|uniref:Glutamine amidotransferase type 1 n=1 Tax=Acetobacterium woodii (strain ATCC 29683 / DSM 1030 / JCM 2381 / KCTC 1655 / WB1) TaxID=931626 RepID=H6LJS2_ACEWD|nr:gamma-glutamyl-gamma-aminobutyrate hydrolase family protein [Acetobacterium woodii]AFA47473.1 glutamine amidotransferase type 1 [Acetobacterium woodii DSM 1030]
MMKAMIGITSTQRGDKLELLKEYADAVVAGGGIPVIIPAMECFPYYEEYLAGLDGILLSGGQDVMPLNYGEEPIEGFHLIEGMTPERDTFELALIGKAMAINMPILGICRGMQVIVIAGGGTLYQDIDTGIERTRRIKHFQECFFGYDTHLVKLQKNTKIFEIIKKEAVMTNSIHHQSVKVVPDGYIVTGRTNDGVIEAVESVEHDFVLGVQWHPEKLLEKNHSWSVLFAAFVKKAVEYKIKRTKSNG